jgi:hypothetical protein
MEAMKKVRITPKLRVRIAPREYASNALKVKE